MRDSARAGEISKDAHIHHSLPSVLIRCLVVFLFGGNPRIKTPLNLRGTRRARIATLYPLPPNLKPLSPIEARIGRQDAEQRMSNDRTDQTKASIKPDEPRDTKASSIDSR
jgi:hypothetical protein